MAEKPRLKKSNEIFGSIATESSRTKRAGGRTPDKNGDQSGNGQSAKARPADNDFLEDDIELSDGPELPSAQLLAEKLLPKKKPRQAAFSFESTAQPEASRTKPERTRSAPQPVAPEPPRASIEFGETSFPVDAPASNNKTTVPVEFHAAPAPAAPASIEFGTDDQSPAQTGREPIPPPTPQPRQRQPIARAPRTVQEPEPTHAVSEYTFQSFEDPKAASSAAPVWEFSAQEPDEPRRESAKRKPEDTQEQPNKQAEPEPERQPEPRRERIIQPLRAETPTVPAYEQPSSPPPQTAFSYEPPTRPQQTPPPEPEISEAERNRQDFLKRIASQFEVQFEEKFEDGVLKPRENLLSTESPRPEPPEPRSPLFAPEPKPRSGPQAPVPLNDGIEGEDFLTYVQRQERERKQMMSGSADRRPVRDLEPVPFEETENEPALGFIEKFEQDIREEEHQRAEDFKETLSQKFMRERERYLKELDIGDEPEPPIIMPEPETGISPSASPRRKLDFQIQPEMHMQDGHIPPTSTAQKGVDRKLNRPSGPVTYTRGGTAMPQDASDNVDDIPVINRPAEPAGGAKKTSEQLLLEHGARARAPIRPAMPKPQPAKLKFTFETPEEHAQRAKGEKESILPAEKWPRRIVLIAMIAGLFALGLVVWSMVSYYNLSSGLNAGTDLMPPEESPFIEDTLNIYNDRVFTQTGTTTSVFFKNAGTLLKNVNVKDYVIIENVEGSGRIRLEDVTVDSAISVKSSGSDTLELHNVKAQRLIVNNPQANMSISITGNSDIDVVELRTKSAVRQSDIGSDYAGVQGMIVNASETGGEIDANLDGLNLRTLETDATTAILAFVNNTRAETVSADGSLSLSGDGKITNLSIGSKVGQGAGDLEDRKDVTLFVKGVAISNINVKSPANLNLLTTVDSISTSDSILLGGEASVATLTLNPKIGSSSRLLIDIVSANVQSVYANTPSRINVTGMSRINELIADDSTYALGNKVNHFKVNADGVIYENEPDNISLANGVRPPQSKADNPNIDYSLGTVQQSLTDVTGEDFATTCGHSRESGGFLLGDGSKDSPYEVSTALQLAHVGSHLASHFKQTADIDISTESNLASNFPSIGSVEAPFEGVFDGRGFAIARLKIVSQSEHAGLFGASKGVIQNVRVYSGEITAASTSPSFAGGIAGLVYDGGQIRSCSNGASVTGNQSARIGGIAGASYGGRVHDCYNYSKIEGFDIVGGIVGLNRQGASVTGSYNAGLVDGRDEVGSVVGRNEDGTVANCYFLEESAGYGIGSGNGTATEMTDDELADPQMAADLSAGNETSLWMPSSDMSSYRYPIHRRPE